MREPTGDGGVERAEGHAEIQPRRERGRCGRTGVRAAGERTSADQKRWVVEEGSHFVPYTRQIHETLAWLDRYQPLPPTRLGLAR